MSVLVYKTNQAMISLLIALGLLMAAVPLANAQTIRPVVFVEGMLVASSQDVVVDEAVTFEINTALLSQISSELIIAVSWKFGDDEFVRSTTVADVEHTYSEWGFYTASVDLVTFENTYSSTTTILVDEAEHPFAQAEAIIENYDVNKNNRLGDVEFFLLVDAWVMGEVTDETFFVAVDVWVSNQVITSLTASGGAVLKPMAESSGTNHINFSAAGAADSQLAVEIFDANGNAIYENRSAGPTLRWNTTTNDGTHVANGVYFYTLTARDSAGQLIQSEPQALMILR